MEERNNKGKKILQQSLLSGYGLPTLLEMLIQMTANGKTEIFSYSS